MSRMRGLVVMGAMATFAVAGCTETQTTTPTTRRRATPTTNASKAVTGSFVGTVEGSDAYVGVVVGHGGEALAYVCDRAGESVDWLDGRLEGDAARLGNDGGAILEVTFADDRASGKFTRPESAPLTFTARSADKPAGLYRAREFFADGEYVGGWVVLPDGTQRGAVRRYETPLPRGAVNTALDLSNPVVTVPGGVLMPGYVDPAKDLNG
jgi:hypothetical protein